MTIQVLHLIDPLHAGWPAVAALAALVRASPSPFSHTVALIGAGPQRDLCRSLALPVTVSVAPPLGVTELAASALRSRLRAAPRPDLIHAWSAPALSLASIVAPGAHRSATIAAPPDAACGPMRSALHTRAVRSARRIIFASTWARDRWAPRMSGPAAALPYPVFPLDLSRRATLRRQWGLPDHVIAIFAVGEPESRLDGRWCAFRAGVVAVGGMPSALVLPSACTSIERALRFTERHADVWRVIINDRPMHETLPACDIAIWRAGPPHTRAEMHGACALGLAAAAGIPAIAEDHPLTRDLLSLPTPPRLTPIDDTVAMSRAIFESIARGATPPQPPPTSSVDAWVSRMNAALLSAVGADAPFPVAALPA